MVKIILNGNDPGPLSKLGFWANTWHIHSRRSVIVGRSLDSTNRYKDGLTECEQDTNVNF